MSKNRLPLLVLVAAALGGYIYWAGLDGSEKSVTSENIAPVAETRGEIQSQQRPVANPLSKLKPDDFIEMVERPLFSATRKPPSVLAPPPETVVVQPQPGLETVVEETPLDASDFSLLAVSGNTVDNIAVIRQASSDQIFHLRKGDQIAGLEVLEVDPKTVTIGKGEETITLAMFQSETRDEAPAPTETEEAPPPETKEQ